MKKLSLLILLACLFSSHDLFLKTDDYFLSENDLVKLYLFNGTFDVSENIITRDRIVDCSVNGPDFEFKPASGNWFDLNDATHLQFKTGQAGTYLAGISTAPKNIELSAEDFNGYLEHDGVLDELAARKQDGSDKDDAVERYSKHVKCVVQVGDAQTDHYSTELGYPIEFVLKDNPYDAQVGESVGFKLLRNGEPLANQLVYYGHRVAGQETSDEHVHDHTYVRSNDVGEGSIKITEPGHWYYRTIHMERIDEEGLDYESNWATITFQIK